MDLFLRLLVRTVGWILSVIMATGFTLGLFYFMQSLIDSGGKLDQRVAVFKIVDATMPEIELMVIEENQRPEPIEEITEPQPELNRKQTSLDSGPSLNIDRGYVALDLAVDLSIATITATDGDYLPLVAISPQYPARARERDIEGWCLVSFTVDDLGNVLEDTIEVLDAEPSGIFNNSSKRAAARFKFQPRITNGVGVVVPGVEYLFRFMFDD